jgi:hypothetical protein
VDGSACHLQDGSRYKYRSTSRVLIVGSGADEQCAGYGRHRTKYRLGGYVYSSFCLGEISSIPPKVHFQKIPVVVNFFMPKSKFCLLFLACTIIAGFILIVFEFL